MYHYQFGVLVCELFGGCGVVGGSAWLASRWCVRSLAWGTFPGGGDPMLVCVKVMYCTFIGEDPALTMVPVLYGKAISGRPPGKALCGMFIALIFL